MAARLLFRVEVVLEPSQPMVARQLSQTVVAQLQQPLRCEYLQLIITVICHV